MKNLILSKYNQLAILFALSAIASLLLMFRIKTSDSFYLIFLVWNIFLAAIPYAITFGIQLKKRWFTRKWIQIIVFSIWLLFLPNAPYILSDFTHLRWSPDGFLAVDACIISSFSLLGLLYMVYSIRDMLGLFFSTLSRKQNLLLRICICLLIGFGIYLGRYLRWNSWDILQNPMHLFSDVSTIVIHPIRNKLAWLITLGYAAMSLLAIQTINKLKWVH